jgi:hypothetical protein
MSTDEPANVRQRTLGRPRWDGVPGRLEVWYATITDPATGTGFWLHHEVVATTRGEVRALGWAAVFPPGEPARVRRFGPEGLAAPGTDERWFDGAGAEVAPGRLAGRAGGLRWALTHDDGGPPLHTFPAYVWDRQLLPSSQVVPYPTSAFTGVVQDGDRVWRLDRAPGAVARIYGHGNAQRWGWLHADLGDGDVLEVVAASGRRPPLRWLPPKVFAQLRVAGRDWPDDPLVATAASSARLGVPRWYARVTTPTHRLRVAVRLPPVASVTLEYRDPDGVPAQCTNSCVADAEIRLERRDGVRWAIERHWSLRGTAHAEFGERPSA